MKKVAHSFLLVTAVRAPKQDCSNSIIKRVKTRHTPQIFGRT
ncbi:hypothetical protein MNBD_ALPHA06-245 [hydrothermal vent metagenome]|uniref:Uncharacterized protein n=1 Tax=hydrothermal vent metagenome TaxID=652676 RepID=A0A3B0S730_9ZZZZ